MYRIGRVKCLITTLLAKIELKSKNQSQITFHAHNKKQAPANPCAHFLASCHCFAFTAYHTGLLTVEKQTALNGTKLAWRNRHYLQSHHTIINPVIADLKAADLFYDLSSVPSVLGKLLFFLFLDSIFEFLKAFIISSWAIGLLGITSYQNIQFRPTFCDNENFATAVSIDDGSSMIADYYIEWATPRTISSAVVDSLKHLR